jgi:hypothetical protein
VFLVEVTQEWSASTQVLVRAPSPAIANDIAKLEIDFSSFDAESSGKSSLILKKLGPEALYDLHQKYEEDGYGLIEDTAYLAYHIDFSLPLRDGTTKTIKRWNGRKISLDELVYLVATPEALEAARLARIESNNGQISLL